MEMDRVLHIRVLLEYDDGDGDNDNNDDIDDDEMS